MSIRSFDAIDRSPPTGPPRTLVHLWFRGQAGGRRSVAEPGSQLGGTIVSRAGGRYSTVLWGRTTLYNRARDRPKDRHPHDPVPVASLEQSSFPGSRCRREGGQRPRTMRPRRNCTGPLARKFRSGCSTAWPAPGCALRSAPRWISPRCPLSHRSCRMRWVNPWRRAQDGSSMTRIGERPMPDRHRVHRKRGKGSEQLDLFGRVESSSPHPPESLRSSFPPLNRGEGAPMSRPVG